MKVKEFFDLFEGGVNYNHLCVLIYNGQPNEKHTTPGNFVKFDDAADKEIKSIKQERKNEIILVV